MPAYDEPFIKATVEDAYEKAEYPDLLYFGIHNQKSSPDLFEDFSMFPNVRVTNAVYPIPPGVAISRLNASMLHIDEEYYYQIDAHNFFAKNWDTTLRRDHELLSHYVEKPIIASSHYCHELSAYEDGNEYRSTFYLNPDAHSQVGRPLKVGERGDTCVDVSRDGEPRFLGKFQEHYMLYGGCGVFASSEIIYDVSYEPFTMYIPEQELFALRACTRGYRIFSNGISVTSSLSKCKKEGGFRSDVFPTAYQALLESRAYEGRGRWSNALSIEYLTGERFGFAGAPSKELYEKYVEESGIDFRKCKRC